MSIKTLLTEHDIAALATLRIGQELLEAAGVRRVENKEAQILLKSKRSNLAGILFPYVHPLTGQPISYRVRRDRPDVDAKGKPIDKYIGVKDEPRRLYFPPGCDTVLNDTGADLFIVEAEKSVLAITSASIGTGLTFAIGTGGCWGWRGTIGKDETGRNQTGPLADWDLIALAGRRVIIVFDVNIATNKNVRDARHGLATELTGRGATVLFVDIPPEPGINGPDDFIGRHGAEAFFTLPRRSCTEPAGTDRRLTLTSADTITPRPTRWLWNDRLALGMLALTAGREGIGKTTLMYQIAADITRGLLAGVYEGKPRRVIVAAAEDSWEHTIVPRLMAAGADLKRISRVDVITAEGVHSMLSLPLDIARLTKVVKESDTALVLLDPLISRLDAKLDTHKDAEVRQALEPLSHMADVTNSVVLGIIHVNKGSSRDPLNMVMGSRAFTSVARAVLFVAEDPDDPHTRVCGQPKNNLGRTDDLPTLTFILENTLVMKTDEGDIYSAKVKWTGESERTIREIVADNDDRNKGKRTKVGDAADWLKAYLEQSHGYAESKAIKEAGRMLGHGEPALKRARATLKITDYSAGFPRKTWWLLPGVVIGEKLL